MALQTPNIHGLPKAAGRGTRRPWMRVRGVREAFAVAAALMAAADSGAQPRYQLRELTAPGVYSTARALNDAEQVAGYYTVADVGPFFTYYYAHACIWQPDGSRTDLGVLEWHVAPGVPTRYYSDHIAADINNAGEVVGAGTWSSGGNGSGPPERAFLWMPDGGSMRPLPALGTPNLSSCRANGISDTHRIVGSASPAAELDANGNVISGYPMVPVMWTTGGDITLVGLLPGMSEGDAVAISPNGRFVVGWLGNAAGDRVGFLWEEGVGMRAIPELAGCAFVDINDAGVIVGNCGQAAFTWSEASGVWFIPLLYSSANYAAGINNTGLVVGSNAGVPIWGPIDVGLLAQAGGGGGGGAGWVVNLQSLVCGSDLYVRSSNAINSRGVFTGRGLTNFAILGTPITAPTAGVTPVTASVCPAGASAFSVSATGGGVGAFNYQWQLLTAPGTWADLGAGPGALPCGGTAYGTPLNSPSVTIGIRPCPGSPTVPQHFQIRCLVTDACGRVTSKEATYTICPADINCSGTLSVQDIFDFLAFYFAADPRADFNGVGGLSVQDIFDFLAAYFAGC